LLIAGAQNSESHHCFKLFD